MGKLSDKLGKKVAVVPGNLPAAYDERQVDIHAKTPDFSKGQKPQGGMKVTIQKIGTLEEGFGNQYRNTNNSVNKP